MALLKNSQTPLTDEELQQATGGTESETGGEKTAEEKRCNSYTNVRDCVYNDCLWKESRKDSHKCFKG